MLRMTRFVSLGLALWVSGCGQGETTMPPYHPFMPGNPMPGGYGSGSGSGSGATDGGIPPGPPMCADRDRRCPQMFTWAGSGFESSVTLLGDFAVDGWTKGVAMTAAGTTFTATVPVAWAGKVTYKFHIVYQDKTEKFLPDPTVATQVDDGFGGKNSVVTFGTCSVWTCVSTAISCPAGATGGFDWRDAVMYFAFVDRFVDGNPANNNPLNVTGLLPAANWQGGDWAGIRQKIAAGYLQSIGVNTLWINMPSDQSESAGLGTVDNYLYSGYHAYWPRNLDMPEPHFGTQAELTGLVTDAHAAGLKVIVDYVMNHVHQDSPTWQMHQSDGWFHPLMVGGQPCICGTGPAACQWDQPPDALGNIGNKQCWFASYLPTFDFTNAAARKFSVDNAISWLQKSGADGVRLDAVKQIEESWLTDFRARLFTDIEPTAKEHIYLVGETFTGNQTQIKLFIDPCKMLDGQFDFPLRNQLQTAVLMRQTKLSDLATFMDANTSYYGAGVMSTFIGNHDVPRAIHFGEDTPLWANPWADGKDRAWQNQPTLPAVTSPFERLAMAFAVLFTNRGIPLLYYGDEIGMAGGGDPDNRRLMEWTGYSTGQQLLLSRVQKLGALRAAHVALRRGDRTTLFVDADGWAYQMVSGADRVIVVLNRSDVAKPIGGLPGGNLTDAVSGQIFVGPTVTVPPRSFLVIAL